LDPRKSNEQVNSSSDAAQAPATVTSYPTWDFSMGTMGGGFVLNYEPHTPSLAGAEIILHAAGP